MEERIINELKKKYYEGKLESGYFEIYMYEKDWKSIINYLEGKK